MVFCYVNSSKWGKNNRLEHGGEQTKTLKKRQKYLLQIMSS